MAIIDYSDLAADHPLLTVSASIYNLRGQIDELLSANDSLVIVDEMISRNLIDEELILINENYVNLDDLLDVHARINAMQQRDNLLLAVCSSEFSRLQAVYEFLIHQ